MKKPALLFLYIIALSFYINAQSIYTPGHVTPEKDFDNVYSEKIFSDSLSTSFFIIIKKGVALHKHEFHTEHVYVLEGTGEMKLGNNNLSIVKGDLVIIPMNSPHSLEVTSREPVKILSFQSPEFKGNDRILLE